jgi:hypothetical protein
MKRGVIRNLFNSALQEAGNVATKAGQIVSEKIDSLLKTDKVKPEDFNFAQMANELMPNLQNIDRDNIEAIANEVRSSQFPTISRVVIHNTILKTYEQYMENVDSLVTEAEATRTTEETIAGFTEMEGPEIRPEGMSYEETNFGEKDVKVYMADFGRTVSITAEALFNDRTGQLLRNARAIGEKAGQHRAKMIIQTIEVLPRTAFKEPTNGSRAFVYKGTAYQSSDFYNATTHAGIDGRLNPNLKTSNALADYTDIENALLLFASMKDSQGDEIVVAPNTILVPPALEVKLFQIMNGASFTPVGQGANSAPIIYHTGNPYGQGGLSSFTPFSSRYLSSNTTWYIGDFKKQLIWLWVFRPATQSLAASADRAFFNKIVVTYKFAYHGGVAHEDYVNIVKNTA